ncbi:TPA: ATP phosphoribosyltransferase [Candidatus Bathyarchaeota archaeon]|nr:ATP phosphoribosyltransferase [Candidatus Bathyarchaeota archaeon]
MRVRIAIPSKGRLYEKTLEVLGRAGIAPTDRRERALYAPTSDPEVGVIFLRAADIPRFVEEGVADLGVTGYDCVVESEADVEELLDLEFGKVDVVVAAREDSGIRSIDDVEQGTRVATKLANITRAYFESAGKPVSVVRVSGAVEVIPYLGVADLIVEVVETGLTLGAHRLRVISTVLESSARLIANKRSLSEKREKISEIALALKSVVRARRKKLIMMNVPEKALRAVVGKLPAMSGPTVARVEAPEPMWEVYSVIDEDEVYRVIGDVKRAGARDIIVLPIERVVR